MPDYCACVTITCPRRANCWRYLMRWGVRQSIASFNADGCSYFWAVYRDVDRTVFVHEADERAAKMLEEMGR